MKKNSHHYNKARFNPFSMNNKKTIQKATGFGHIQFTPHLKVSAAVKKGNVREKMEDEILITKITHNRDPYYIFLVLDGHGGPSVARYVKKNFVDVFKRNLKKMGRAKIVKVIQQTFLDLNESVKNYNSGSTASLLLIIDNPREIYTAHVGDSSIYGIIYNNGNSHSAPKAHLLTPNHNVKRSSEKKRVEQSPHHSIDGNYVATKNGHMLAITRALGDNDFGPIVKAMPQVKKIKNNQYDTFAVASDGIWDVMSGKTLAQMVNTLTKHNEWKTAAHKINEWRNAKYDQHDNTSLILVYVEK